MVLFLKFALSGMTTYPQKRYNVWAKFKELYLRFELRTWSALEKRTVKYLLIPSILAYDATFEDLIVKLNLRGWHHTRDRNLAHVLFFLA